MNTTLPMNPAYTSSKPAVHPAPVSLAPAIRLMLNLTRLFVGGDDRAALRYADSKYAQGRD